MNVGIIGLGFVGLSFAAVLGSKGFSVIAIDKNKITINKAKSGIAPFYEPKLNNLLSKSVKKSLKIYSSIQLAKDCDIIFITVGTPTKKGRIDLTSIKTVAKELGCLLSSMEKKPIIIVKSTVLPGTTRKVILPIIEKNSKKKQGNGFEIATNPEFLREGKAIEDTLKPHVVVIGSENKITIKKIKKFYNSLYGTKIPYILTNPQTAELIKYANNSFLATKISFINQIAQICQSIPGTNVDEIAKGIGLDPRIGSLFLKAGPGYGGSCLPKDLQALINFSKELGQKPIFLESVKKTNDAQISEILSILKKELGELKNKRITILGLSFKEDSDDIRESVSIKLVVELLAKNAKIVVHDPKAIQKTKAIFGNKIIYSESISDALTNSECLVLMTPWKQYSTISDSVLRKMKKRTIIDTRRMLEIKKLDASYKAIGKG